MWLSPEFLLRNEGGGEKEEEEDEEEEEEEEDEEEDEEEEVPCGSLKCQTIKGDFPAARDESSALFSGYFGFLPFFVVEP